MQPVNQSVPYYQGDDITIIIYPKDSNGDPLEITSADAERAYFRIANVRGPNSDPSKRYHGNVVIEQINGGPFAIVASLDGEIGANIQNGWVYDIGYFEAPTFEHRITVLTGTFSVILEVLYP